MSLTNQQQETQAILELAFKLDLWKAEAERWREIKEPQWQPIDTAPKDGTHILVWGKSMDYDADFTVAVFRDDSWWASVNLCCGPVGEPLQYARNMFTHWMPLPPAP